MITFSNATFIKIASFCVKFFVAVVVATTIMCVVIHYYHTLNMRELELNGRPFAHRAPNSYICKAYEGFMIGTLDFNGLNNKYCVERNIPTPSTQQTRLYSLLLGSSHMEAYQVPMNSNCCYLCNQKLESQLGVNVLPMYNIGVSENRFVDLVSSYSEALDFFHPKRFAVIETMILPDPSSVKNFALVQKKMFNRSPLKLGSNRFVQAALEHILSLAWNVRDGLVRRSQNGKDAASFVTNSNEEKWNDENVVFLREFLKMISEPSKSQNVQPILFYHPHFTLCEDGSARLDSNFKDIDLYRSICDEQGIVFLCLGDRFMQEYEENNILPYGFWNTRPNAGHLNKDGHRMIAEELCKVIERLEEERKENAQ